MQPISHLAGRYLLRERVGGSGRSEVWQAWDEVLARTVAVRLVSAKRAGPGFRRRFQEEIRAVAGVLHPHIVVIYDYGEAASTSRIPTPYVIMEYFEGESLADRLHGGLPARHDALLTCGQIAGALAAAHAAGIVHCDLKPSNVLLTSAGAKVLGFGVARVMRDEECFAPGSAYGGPGSPYGPGYGVGSEGAGRGDAPYGDWPDEPSARPATEMPVYLAPEDIGEGPVAPPADVYALGIILTECLTGSRTFDGPMPPEVPGEIAELAVRCRSTDPGVRPPAAEAERILLAAARDLEAAETGRANGTGPLRRLSGLATAGASRAGSRDGTGPTGSVPKVGRSRDGAFTGPFERPAAAAATGGVAGPAAGARQTGADRTGADRTGARQTGARQTGARQTGARQAAGGAPFTATAFMDDDPRGRAGAFAPGHAAANPTASGDMTGMADVRDGAYATDEGPGGRAASGERHRPGGPSGRTRRPVAPAMAVVAGLAVTAFLLSGKATGVVRLVNGDSAAASAASAADQHAASSAGRGSSGGATGAAATGSPGPVMPPYPAADPIRSRTLDALGRMRPLIQQGAAGGEIRSDVAVDLNNVIGNLQHDLTAGRQVDLRQRVTELYVKIWTRLGENGLTPGRAGELTRVLTDAWRTGG